MLRFRSLTAKFIFISLIFIAFISLLVTSGFLFTHHIAGEAERINLAGQLRYSSFEMAWWLHRVLEAENSELRESFIRELKNAMDRFDSILIVLKSGDRERNINPAGQHKEAAIMCDGINNEWNNSLKPMILKIVELPEKGVRKLIDKYEARIPSYVDEIDKLVGFLSAEHENEIKEFDRFRLYALGVFIVMTVFIVIFAKKTIIAPVRKLTDASLEMKKGNFDVRVDVRGRDEIGELGSTFNSMAQTIDSLIDEQAKHLLELDVLNKIAEASRQSLTVEVMLDKVLDAILNLEPLTLEKKGAIFLHDEKEKVLKLAVSRHFSDEQAVGCSSVPYGECLCGIVAEKVELLTSKSNIEDKRHTKVYPDAKEHGHIILPLISRGKTLGVLCLYLSKSAELTDREVELYKSIADIISVSLQNALNHRHVAMLAQSLESSGDVIVITDTEGLITYVNSEAIRELGYLKDELVGQPVSIMQSPNNPSGLGEEILKMTIEGGWFGEVINIRKDGSEYPLLLTTSPVRDAEDKIIALIGIGRDITERKQMEAELKRYSEGLESLVKGRTAELDEARLQAEAANRAKSEFLANMSHELRTPLNSILGFSEVMADGMTGPLTDEQKEFLNDIHESGTHLLSLINDILDLSKIEAGKMGLELSEFNMRELIKGSLLMFKEKAMKHSIELKAEIQEGIDVIIADGRKLKQVIFNLLSNAMKFTPERGEVGINAVKTDEGIQITVWDTGIGISREDMSKLFQPFQQIETTLTKKYPGTGLGLNLSKKFIELHGGNIWVESEAGKGSRFVFVIPVKQ